MKQNPSKFSGCWIPPQRPDPIGKLGRCSAPSCSRGGGRHPQQIVKCVLGLGPMPYIRTVPSHTPKHYSMLEQSVGHGCFRGRRRRAGGRRPGGWQSGAGGGVPRRAKPRRPAAASGPRRLPRVDLLRELRSECGFIPMNCPQGDHWKPYNLDSKTGVEHRILSRACRRVGQLRGGNGVHLWHHCPARDDLARRRALPLRPPRLLEQALHHDPGRHVQGHPVRCVLDVS